MTDPKIEVSLGVIGVFTVRVVRDAYGKKFLNVARNIFLPNGQCILPEAGYLPASDYERGAVLERLILETHPLYNKD